MMNGGPISWKLVNQKSVSLSTAESEWYATSETGKEVLYLRIGTPTTPRATYLPKANNHLYFKATARTENIVAAPSSARQPL